MVQCLTTATAPDRSHHRPLPSFHVCDQSTAADGVATAAAMEVEPDHDDAAGAAKQEDAVAAAVVPAAEPEPEPEPAPLDPIAAGLIQVRYSS